MPNTRDIKRRIRSIENTRQITRAMEMVAATKMRRAQAAVLASREYAARAQEILAAVGAANVIGQPLLAKRPVKRQSIVLFTSDRGLAGTMNTNLLRKSLEEASANKVSTTFVTVGKKGEQGLRAQGGQLGATFTGLADRPDYDDIRPVAQIVIEEFQAARTDQVILVYPNFVSTLRNEPKVTKLLPAEAPEHVQLEESSALTLFEPSEEEVLSALLPRLVEIQLWQALLETKASEHSSRMIAMRNASDNASDLLDDLTFSFNQARQAAITTEIAEIASGAEALAI